MNRTPEQAPTKFTNEEDGVSVHVTRGERGYHVALRDDDAGEFVGLVIIYDTEDAAIAYAQKIVA